MTRYEQCMIAYNPGSAKIEVGPWPDETGWSDRYHSTVGACFGYFGPPEVRVERRLVQMLLEFHHAVVRDRVPVDAAHAAFWLIEEYRAAMVKTYRSRRPGAVPFPPVPV
jgi:hypothetical protein